MSAKLFEFTGNPRPRVTQSESAILLVLPVVRIEGRAAERRRRRADRRKENEIVDLRGFTIISSQEIMFRREDWKW